MRYTNFHIKTFKGIKDLKFDLKANPDFNITTLVGLNESGKTTVLEAINFLQEGASKEHAHKLIPREKSSNFTGHVVVEGTLTLDDDDQKKLSDFCQEKDFHLAAPITSFSIERTYEFKGSEPVKLMRNWTIALNGKLSSRHQTNKDLFKEDRPRWDAIIEFISDYLMPKIIYYPNFLFDFPEKIYLDEAIVEGKTPKQQLYRKVMQDILDSLDENLDLQEHIHDRLKGGSPAQRSALQATLLKISASITSTVIKPWNSIFKSTDSKEVLVQAEVEDENSESPKYYLTIKLRQGNELYEIDERSLGFKWFFAFLLFTEYRKNRSTDSGETLFLVDEPASNLHSTMQEKLTEKVESIVDKSRLIYTTHSQHLINPMWLESTFIVINKAINYEDEMESNTRETDVDVVPYKKFAAEHPNQKDYFQPILDTLDYKPSKLEMVPKIVVVEGKNDYYTIRYMLEVVIGEDIDFGLYPGNGAKGNLQVISLYLAWAKEFIVSLDADNAGKDAKTFYTEKLGKTVEDRIFTLKDIVSGWDSKATEDLFTEKEKMAVINSLYPRQLSYSKEKFNIAIQNLLYQKESLNFNATTLDRFKKISAFYKSKLDSAE